MKYISNNDFTKLLETLKKDYEVYLSVKKNDQRFYQKYTEFSEDIVIGEVEGRQLLQTAGGFLGFFSDRGTVVDEHHGNIGETDNVPGVNEAAFHFLFIDEGAAGGVAIVKHILAFLETDLGVKARDEGFLDDQVVLELAANIRDDEFQAENLAINN